MKKLLAIVLATLMVFALCACKDDHKHEEKTLIIEKEAIDAALNHAGYKIQEVTDIHVHMSTHEDTPVYAVYFTFGNQSNSIVVDGYTAEILDIDVPHGH